MPVGAVQVTLIFLPAACVAVTPLGAPGTFATHLPMALSHIWVVALHVVISPHATPPRPDTGLQISN